MWPESWRPESLSGNLPPRHPDEPASLRQDIADELADHLASAAAEELRIGADEKTARATALARFGDPAQISRQLWLEAMKEPIMRQRTLLVVAGLLVLAVFTANGLAWMAFQQLRDSNAALVARLESGSNPREWGQSADLTVKLVTDGEPAKPVTGWQVELHGEAVEGQRGQAHGQRMIVREASDTEGAVRYAPIRPGVYDLDVSTPWNWRSRRTVSLLARPWTETIVCPAHAPELAQVHVQIDWPKDLADHELVMNVEFTPSEGEVSIAGHSWRKETSFSTIRDTKGSAPRQFVGEGQGLEAFDFQPPQPLQAPADVYWFRTNVFLRGYEISKDPLAFQYIWLVELQGSDFAVSRFTAQPGAENDWRINFQPEGVRKIGAALRKHADEQKMLQDIEAEKTP